MSSSASEQTHDQAHGQAGGHTVFQRYAALFRTKGVAPLVLQMVVARMPTGCVSMLLVLFVAASYDAAVAGAASAAWTVGLALLSPYLGRLVDRGLGPIALRVTAVLCAFGLFALIALTQAHAPAGAVLAAAFLFGALNPPVAGTTRSLWSMLVSEELLPVAYSFEILLIDALYVSGPLLASVFIAFGVPQVGMVATTVCLVAGSCALSFSDPVMRYAQRGRLLHASTAHGTASVRETALLRNPSVWAVLIACMGAMMFSGWMETLVPLHFSNEGNAAQGSVVISLWSLGSIAGVLGFVRVQPLLAKLTLTKQLVLFTALYLIPTVLVAFVFRLGFLPLCAAMLLVGLLVSPCTNLHYQVGGQQAPETQHAEMFSWLNTATSAGISLGALLSGNCIELIGSQSSFCVPFLFVLASLFAALVLVAVSRKGA